MSVTSDSVGATSFRADINGLRAIAILLVAFFHFGVPGFSSGFIGVDIFFVISGFLITQMLAGRPDGRPVSLRGFYLSRVSRIYPAMLALIATLLALGYLFLEPAAYSRLGRHALLSLAGVVNYGFYAEADYFAPDRESNWLLHLWSLSVELQLYLVAPPIVLWAQRRGRRWLMSVLLGLFGLSLASAVYVSFSDASAAFYFMPLRLWEFLAGALAFSMREFVPARWQWQLSRAGLIAIAAALPVVSLGGLPAALSVLLPVAGATAILAAPSTTWLLTNAASQFVGVISYSFYLWHWPVWVAARHFGRGGSGLDVAGLLAVTLVLAFVSRIAIERPFHRPSAARASRRHPVMLAAAVCVVLAVAGAVVQQRGFPARVPALIADVMASAALGDSIRQHRCALSPPDGGEKLAEECFAPTSSSLAARAADEVSEVRTIPPEVMLFGDSHAAHLWPGFVRSSVMQTFRLSQVTAGACPPFLFEESGAASTSASDSSVFDPVTGVVRKCTSITTRAFSHIERSRPRVVVLSARWSYYDTHSTDVIEELRKVILALARLQVETLIVGPIPEWTPPLPQKALEAMFRHGGRLPARMHDPSHAAIEELDRRLAAMSRESGAAYVSLLQLLCAEDGCTVSVTSHDTRALIAYDIAHLTIAGSEWIVEHGVAPAVGRIAE